MDKFIRFLKGCNAVTILVGKNRFHFIAILLLLSGISVWAAPVTTEKANRAGKKFLTRRHHFARSSDTTVKAAAKSKKQIRGVAPVQKEDSTIGYLVQLEPTGYILMAADDNAPPVKLYSEDSSFDQLPPGFKAVIELEMQEDLAQLVLMPQQESKFRRQWEVLLDEPNSIQSAGSGTYLLTTSWNQDSPYNYYCPAASGGPDDKAYAGCSAAAMAQILRYHSWPVAVTADHTYTDYYGLCTGTFSISDAGLDDYDWDNMPDYIDSYSPTAQIEAVAQLIYHCGVAMNSDYEADGTAAYTNTYAPAFRNSFDYTCDNYVSRGSTSTAAWFNKIVTDIDADRPIFYAMWESAGTGGHAVVCDGYNSTDTTIHLNLGWSGFGTAWYNVDSVEYGGYVWTVHGGVFNIAQPTYGSLQVTLSPQGAINSGAQWRRTGTTTWYNSGDIETGLVTGNYTVEFQNIVGWVTPANMAVTITQNHTAEVLAAYTSIPYITIGDETTTGYYPMATISRYARTQTIYQASELGGEHTLYSLALNVSVVPGLAMNNFTIRMKHTDLSVYSTPSWESTGWTIVYQTNQTISTTGWKEFMFSTPFEYNGTQNLMVDISFSNSTTSSSGYCYYSSPGGNRALQYRTSTSAYGTPLTWSGTTPPTTAVTSVLNIRLTIASKTADLTGDGFVDMEDFTLFSSWWQSDCDVSNNLCDGADIDWSGQSDLSDLDTLVSYWLEEI